MDILKRLRSQAEQVEVIHLKRQATTVEFEGNRFKTSKVEGTSGFAVRIVRGGRLGFSASSDSKAFDRLIGNVLESASFGDEIPLTFPAGGDFPQVQTYDPAIAELPVARLVQFGQEIVDVLLAIDPEVRLTIKLERGTEEMSLVNQAGADLAFQRSPLSVFVQADRIDGDDVLILYDLYGTTVWEEDYLRVAHRLAEKLRMSRSMTSTRTSTVPVLFSPSGALALALPLMLGVNGRNVFTGVSPLAGRVGEKLFDEKITVVDDATLDGRFSSAPCDDEGVPHQRNVLVEHGVLRGFLYDLKTAAQSRVESTGNGSRELFSPPSPSPTNLIVAPGDAPVAEMIGGIEDGLLVDDVLGLGQGNIISGAFSNPLSLAYKIKGGEITGRVKNLSIAGNVYDLLKDVAAVSRETQWVYGRMSLPYVLIPEMKVVAKE